MTAPIQEPTTDRSLQNFAFQRDQIFRRPAPIAAAAGCAPWIRVGQGSHTYNTGIQALLVSEFLWYDPALVTQDVDFSWTTAAVGSDTTWLVSSRKEGWYMWDALINVGIGGALTDDAGGIEFYLTDTAATELSLYSETWDIFDTTTFATGWQGAGHSFVHASGFLHVFSTNRQWRFALRQGSGDSIDIGVEWITIWRLCEDDSDTWVEEIVGT